MPSEAERRILEKAAEVAANTVTEEGRSEALAAIVKRAVLESSPPTEAGATPDDAIKSERLRSRLMGLQEGTSMTLEDVWEAWSKLDQVEFTKWLSKEREENKPRAAAPSPASREEAVRVEVYKHSAQLMTDGVGCVCGWRFGKGYVSTKFHEEWAQHILDAILPILRGGK